MINNRSFLAVGGAYLSWKLPRVSALESTLLIIVKPESVLVYFLMLSNHFHAVS